MLRLVSIGFMLLLSVAAGAEQVRVENVRSWPAPDRTRVVLDVSAPVQHKLLTLDNPQRLVIDLMNARLLQPAPRPNARDALLRAIRAAPRHKRDLRVVLDLKREVRPRSFLLKPNKTYGHRLVIDIEPVTQDPSPRTVKAELPTTVESALRDVVVAIDAGHGGEDPGAIGPKGTREKDVVFAIARRLAKLIDGEPGMRAVMVRSGDYYIKLRKRMQIAREHKADLFVSIHADAFKDRRVRGSSVYVLSRNGASSEAARWLAAQENAADLVGGVSLDDKDDLLKSVLLDLSQTATLNASSEAASTVLAELRRIGKIHKGSVQRAGFVVLKSPDIPSILVETAYISNPKEERKLRKESHQRALAKSIMLGVRGFFSNNAPPGTLLAAREHVIARGETLSHIAKRYQVSLKRLRTLNDLASDRIEVGQVLRIPAATGS